MGNPYVWVPILIGYSFFFVCTFCHQCFDNFEDPEDAFAMALLWPVYVIRFVARGFGRLPNIVGRMWNE